MNEIEGRVRAAMLGATEQAPAGLLERVYRRRRRHRRRAIAGYAAAAVAAVLAVPPIGHELAGRAMPREPGVGGSVGVAPVKPAPPGTLLLTCNDANWGQLPSGWRAGSFHAGPLWFVGGRQKGGYVHDSSFRLRDHQGNSYSGFRGDFMIVEVADGSTVTVKPDPAARSYFWFSDGYNGPNPKKLPAGDTGFTFRACPRGNAGPNGPLTDFYLGYQILAHRAAPVDVWTSPTATPIRVLFTSP